MPEEAWEVSGDAAGPSRDSARNAADEINKAARKKGGVDENDPRSAIEQRLDPKKGKGKAK